MFFWERVCVFFLERFFFFWRREGVSLLGEGRGCFFGRAGGFFLGGVRGEVGGVFVFVGVCFSLGGGFF